MGVSDKSEIVDIPELPATSLRDVCASGHDRDIRLPNRSLLPFAWGTLRVPIAILELIENIGAIMGHVFTPT